MNALTPYDLATQSYFRDDNARAEDVDTKDHPLLEIVLACLDQAFLHAEQDLLNFEDVAYDLIQVEIDTLVRIQGQFDE